MKKLIFTLLAVLFIFSLAGCASGTSIEEYSIYLREDANAWERNVAYDAVAIIEKKCGIKLDVIISESRRTDYEIVIGRECLTDEERSYFDYDSMGYSSFGIEGVDGKYILSAATENGIKRAIYHFAENCVSDGKVKSSFSYVSGSENDRSEPDTSKKLNVSIESDSGYDVFKVHESVPSGYRYGPSIIVNDDGSIDMWLAGGGSGTEQWDWIVYMHSKDGEEWSEEKCVLQPTPNALDHYSCCDPGVIYINGYYYLGYTSTSNANQCDNNLFVARSENPDGPFEKWNGSGWGGNDPKPIVYFSEDQSLWGAGEVSFVEVEGILYIYYTMSGDEGHTTRVATADALSENWPLTMEYKGIALGAGTNDAIDVKYVDEYGKFIAVASEERLSANSYLMFYESNDGLSFEPVDAVKENVYYFCHNPGIAGSPNGHITADTRTMVAYAYGKGWGVWNTRLQDIMITLGDDEDFSEKSGINIRKPIQYDDRDLNLLRFVGISTGNRCVMSFPSNQRTIIPTLVACDITHASWDTLNNYRNKVNITIEDESVVKRAGSSIIAFDVVGVGETMINFEYEGMHTQLLVVIYDREQKEEVVSVEPMAYDTLIIDMDGDITHQIKSVVKYGDGSWISAWSQTEHSVSYEYDSSALEIDETSHITPKKKGTYEVKIKAGEKSAVLKVEIK